MKTIFLSIVGLIMSLTVIAQPPIRPQGQRVLPNQFRDFVDHQQRWEMERPRVERKDGKVIITMSEQQFKRMQQMRAAQRFRMAQHRQGPPCSKCERHHGKPFRRKI
jgi:hypothetical protein